MDLAINNLQKLICHKTQTAKPNHTGSQYVKNGRSTIFPSAFDPVSD